MQEQESGLKAGLDVASDTSPISDCQTGATAGLPEIAGFSFTGRILDRYANGGD